MSKKYWDIIPQKKTAKRELTIHDLLELFDKTNQDNKELMPYTYKWSRVDPNPNGCLHKACSNCHGTGQGVLGTCVHALSCPCPSCSPMCSVMVTL